MPLTFGCVSPVHFFPGSQAAFRDLKLEPEVVARFHVMGGECNYLLRVTGAQGHVFLSSLSLCVLPAVWWKNVPLSKESFR